MTTTTDDPKTFLISNTHLPASTTVTTAMHRDDWTWILFVEKPVIESGFDLAAPWIEVYKYIKSPAHLTAAERQRATMSKVVSVQEARAEWKFWIGLGFQRITDKDNKGWKYTEDIRERSGNKLVDVMKGATSCLTATQRDVATREVATRVASLRAHMTQKKLDAENSETNERETA
jgi:hypothetical protein